MSDAQKLMAEVTELHQFIRCNHSSIGPEDHCSCGHRPYGWIQYASHLAAEVDKALGGLTREERWTPIEEDGLRWKPRSRAQAMDALLRYGAGKAGAKAVEEESPLARIEGEFRFVSGWTVTE
jgi:hypothetical protein